MSLQSLKIVNVRNFDEFFMEFTPGVNILLGPNGSGKTTVLEAIYYLCFLKSFRGSTDAEMLKESTDHFSIRGQFVRSGSDVEIQANFVRRGARRILKNGVRAERLSDVVGFQPLVLQSPEDIRITLGGSKEKRLFFNRLISQIYPGFLDDLLLHTRLMKQRNAYLKQLKEKKTFSYDTQLEIYDDQLSAVNYSIFRSRKEIIRVYLQIFTGLYAEFYPDSGEEPLIRYSSMIEAEDRDEYQRIYREKSRTRVESEIALNRTLLGINYDKIKFFREGRDMENSASQGEHKLWMALMRLSEGELLRREYGEEPLFLFDDLFSELDLDRTAELTGRVADKSQVLISSTDLSDVRRHGISLDKDTVRVLNFNNKS